MPCCARRGHDLEHLLHDQRRQTLARLVEQQQLRVQQQGAGDCQHLLLAAGQLPALVGLALREAREQLVDAGNRPWPGHFQRNFKIFLDRQVGEDTPAFRHVADAERGDAVRLPVGGGMAEDAHRALARMGQAHQAAQRRGLAGAVAAQQRDDLAFAHFEPDAVQDVALAVKSVEAFCLERHVAHAAVFPR